MVWRETIAVYFDWCKGRFCSNEKLQTDCLLFCVNCTLEQAVKEQYADKLSEIHALGGLHCRFRPPLPSPLGTASIIVLNKFIRSTSKCIDTGEVSSLVFWTQSTTRDYIRAKNNAQSVSYLLCTRVIKPQIIPQTTKSITTKSVLKQIYRKNKLYRKTCGRRNKWSTLYEVLIASVRLRDWLLGWTRLGFWMSVGESDSGSGWVWVNLTRVLDECGWIWLGHMYEGRPQQGSPTAFTQHPQNARTKTPWMKWSRLIGNCSKSHNMQYSSDFDWQYH